MGWYPDLVAESPIQNLYPKRSRILRNWIWRHTRTDYRYIRRSQSNHNCFEWCFRLCKVLISLFPMLNKPLIVELFWPLVKPMLILLMLLYTKTAAHLALRLFPRDQPRPQQQALTSPTFSCLVLWEAQREKSSKCS